jgi:hypothetical protein
MKRLREPADEIGAEGESKVKGRHGFTTTRMLVCIIAVLLLLLWDAMLGQYQIE